MNFDRRVNYITVDFLILKIESKWFHHFESWSYLHFFVIVYALGFFKNLANSIYICLNFRVKYLFWVPIRSISKLIVVKKFVNKVWLRVIEVLTKLTQLVEPFIIVWRNKFFEGRIKWFYFFLHFLFEEIFYLMIIIGFLNWIKFFNAVKIKTCQSEISLFECFFNHFFKIIVSFWKCLKSSGRKRLTNIVSRWLFLLEFYNSFH